MGKIFERIIADNWFNYKLEVADQQKEGCYEILAKQDLATEKALRFGKHWFPKSQVSCLVDPDNVSHYFAPTWIIKQKGL